VTNNTGLARKLTPAKVGRYALRSGAKIVRRIANLSYATARIHCVTQLRANRKEPLLVFQPGKVGSSTIEGSLAALDLDYTICHVHWMTPERLASQEALYNSALRNRPSGTRKQRFYPRHVWQAQYLRSQLEKNSEPGWKTITLTRDPIARNVSSFFENLEVIFGYGCRKKVDSLGIEQVVGELLELFHREYVRRSGVASLDADPVTWFDEEMKTVFDIDVYSSGFPRTKGYKIYHGSKAVVLLVKLEQLNACARAAFEEFLGLSEFRLVNVNVGEDKDYADVYRRFRDKLVLSREYVDEMYASRYVRHFYTEEEIAAFRSKWLK
jgi:hypothetical protein